MDLQSKLIQEVMLEAGKRIATIDRNRGLIAECEALAATLNEASGTSFYSPLVTVHEDSICARVHIGLTRKSEVLRVIKSAGLEVLAEGKTYPDSIDPHWANDTTLALNGFDVAVNLSCPIDELKAA